MGIILDKIKEWKLQASYIVAEAVEIFDKDNEKPWDKVNRFQREDVDGILHITLFNGKLLPYFYGTMSVYMVIYESKDKNTTQSCRTGSEPGTAGSRETAAV